MGALEVTRVYALFDDDGLIVQFFDDYSHPPVVETIPPDLSGDLGHEPESDHQGGVRFVRRNDLIPARAVEVSEADRAAIVSAPQFRRWLDGRLHLLPIPKLGEALTVPDNPTLSDWRVALLLWKRGDGKSRLEEVTAKVSQLIASGHPFGLVARERLEYANNVLRAQLVQLADALGFTAEEIDQSLWRADRVRQGDLTGEWPLPEVTD